jgi:protoheme IX farnesyltransferase
VNALTFGVALGLLAFGFLWATVNLLAATLTTTALLFYVLVYTLWLKRRTPQNIVIGGAAGAMPVLVGWAAVTGRVELPALALFAIVFYWTPPHFWALSMRYEREYAAARVPMMPVVYGREETAKHILLYSFLLLAMSLIFFSVARMGVIYLASALALNGVFIYWAIRVRRDPAPRVAWSLFRFSIYYLALLFAAMAVDELFPLRGVLH